MRFAIVYPLVIWLFISAHTTERRLHVGIVIVIIGELIRLWANGYVGHVKVNATQKLRNDPKVGQLITAGPYAFVRHPLYLGTCLIGAGLCIISGNLWFSLGALMFFLIVYKRKMAKEEALLRDEIGTPYLIYQTLVPRWLPIGRRHKSRQGRWSLNGILASKEWKTLIWVIVVLLALYVREESIQEKDFLVTSHKLVKHIIVIASLILLIAIDGTIELVRRASRK